MKTTLVGGGSGNIGFRDTGAIDAFGRLRVSNPQGVFDTQFTYNLAPLVFEQIVLNTGAAIAHDAVNRNALMTFAATPTGGKAFMQTYQYFRYQPGKSQEIAVTFNMIEAKANVLKFAGYSDGVNGIEFQNNGTTNQWTIYSSSSNGNKTVVQADWNMDKLDGTGPSGITLDITKQQIAMIDFQALYVGRVRVGFNIGGCTHYVHQFNHANLDVHPYIATANLPIRCGMTCTGTVSTTMKFNCSTVISEGGSEHPFAYEVTQNATGVTAASGAVTHVLSLRPKLLFNGIVNRTVVGILEVSMVVTGSNSVYWELFLGQAISGTTTFIDVNTNYSSMEYNILGTISGAPALELDSGYVAASNTAKSSMTVPITMRYPITLDAAGAQRLNGTITLAATGIGGASAIQAGIKWTEIR